MYHSSVQPCDFKLSGNRVGLSKSVQTAGKAHSAWGGDVVECVLLLNEDWESGPIEGLRQVTIAGLSATGTVLLPGSQAPKSAQQLKGTLGRRRDRLGILWVGDVSVHGLSQHRNDSQGEHCKQEATLWSEHSHLPPPMTLSVIGLWTVLLTEL